MYSVLRSPCTHILLDIKITYLVLLTLGESARLKMKLKRLNKSIRD